MGSNRARLLRDLGRLEKRLRREWAAESPPVPEELHAYREAWLSTFTRPARHKSFAALRRAVLASRPLVVGDFHPMQRARRHLARLLREIPELRRPSMLLELLPRGAVMTAEAAARHPELRLVDGRLCGEVYRHLLRELAQRDGLVAGAWVEGNAEARDAAAGDCWQQLAERHPERHWILFFGDWHLAEEHLPQALRQRGASPLMIHQSPEPLWTRRRREREEYLDLDGGHWAWLHTPPLSYWASALQPAHDEHPEYTAEVSEHLVEGLAIHLGEVLQIGEPSGRPAVWPASEWCEFHATLPAPDRRALSHGHPPKVTVVHPHLPAIWIDGQTDLNQLIEAAAHVLACEWPLGERSDFGGRLRARAFRRLWASHLNPFLRPQGILVTADRLFPGLGEPGLARELGKLAQAFAAGRIPQLGARQRLLALEVLGIRAGTSMAAQERVDPAFVHEFLSSGGESFNWADLMATIRAA